MSDLSRHAVSVMRSGRSALDAVDARIVAGRLTVVIGPNGAGKFTLPEVAGGLLAPTSVSSGWGEPICAA